MFYLKGGLVGILCVLTWGCKMSTLQTKGSDSSNFDPKTHTRFRVWIEPSHASSLKKLDGLDVRYKTILVRKKSHTTEAPLDQSIEAKQSNAKRTQSKGSFDVHASNQKTNVEKNVVQQSSFAGPEYFDLLATVQSELKVRDFSVEGTSH